MEILYLHGFGSSFDPTSEKIRTLKSLGNVFGIDIDWTKSPTSIIETHGKIISKKHPDLIVGTSMGGWGAASLGTSHGIPFVAMNPAINPSQSLKRHIGKGIDYEGRPFCLEEHTVAEYTPLKIGGCGLILLDLADDVIDPKSTLELYSQHYRCEMFQGGSHRFEHITESLEMIRNLYDTSETVSGFGDT